MSFHIAIKNGANGPFDLLIVAEREKPENDFAIFHPFEEFILCKLRTNVVFSFAVMVIVWRNSPYFVEASVPASLQNREGPEYSEFGS